MKISFKTFLAEKSLSPSVFAATLKRLSNDAKLGFEIEVWAPQNDATIEDDEEVRDKNWKDAAALIADSLRDVIGQKVVVGYGGSENAWRIVADGSIESDSTGIGIEIISPPLPINDALEDLSECFRFIKRQNFETNSTTGLHLNISLPDLKRLLDPLKLILFMGEEHVLDLFDRKGNTFALTHVNDILAQIEEDGRPLDSELLRVARQALTGKKYKTVNLGKLPLGYLEFRVAGNQGYENSFNKISDLVGRFLTVLELACDPTAERKEYLKKVTKLFSRGSTETAEMNLEELVRKTADLMNWQQIQDLLTQDVMAKPLITYYIRDIALEVGKLIIKKKYQPSDRIRAEFKQLIRKIQKKVPDILTLVITDDVRPLQAGELPVIERFYEAFKLRK